MPVAQFIPMTNKSDEDGRLQLAAISQMNSMLVEGQTTALQNQLLQKQLSNYDQQFQTDVALKQLAVQTGQQTLSEAQTTAPDRARSVKATADLQDLNVGFVKKAQPYQLDSLKLADQLAKIQVQTAGIDAKVAEQTAGFRVAEIAQRVDVMKAQTQAAKDQSVLLNKQLREIDMKRRDEQVSQLAQIWATGNLDAESLGKARAAFPGSILDSLPVSPQSGDFGKILGDIAQDPSKPDDQRRQAVKLMADGWAAKMGIKTIDPGVAMQLKAAGLPVPENPMDAAIKFLPLPTRNGTKATTQPSTQPSGSPFTATGKVSNFEYKPTGIDGVDNQLYHFSQRPNLNTITVADAENARGGISRAINAIPIKVNRDGDTFQFKDQSKVNKIYGEINYTQSAEGTPAEVIPDDTKAILDAQVVDKNASLRQQSTYEAFLSNIVKTDLTTPAGTKNFEDNFNKIVSLYPDAFSPVQMQALAKLKAYFEE